MPMCSFEGCFSGSRKKDYRKSSNVHLHKFPKDPEMRRKWLDQIKLGSNVTKVNFETGVVCSNHFSTDSFASKTFVQRTANFSPITGRRLLPNAIPLSTFGYYYDDIPYNRMSSSNSPSCTIIRTPSGPFSVTKSNDFSQKSQCCSNLEFNFSELCNELEVKPLCEVEILENSNEEFQKYAMKKLF
ncbi:uncharacterized protein LOC103310235 [Acyrthosiphon pisum]|uniref:THAP-type domain-containing protein n=1 Tax=Acyrthosiphon pisum TaxID=7029 RepID=A0A8R2NT70_ACYPI|nr:uncharacterized protein LOC103310235 [Acyrthosiphon pisum]